MRHPLWKGSAWRAGCRVPANTSPTKVSRRGRLAPVPDRHTARRQRSSQPSARCPLPGDGATKKVGTSPAIVTAELAWSF